MKIRSITMTAACMLVGGLTLAGCQANGGSSASGSNSTTQAGGTAGAGAVNAVSTGTAAAGSGSNSGSGSTSQAGSSTSGSNSGSGYAVCQAGDLKISLAGNDKLTSQYVQWVQLANDTSTPCTMDGFAGVNLVGSASGNSNYTWPLDRDSDSYSKITLQAGESAYFGIKYLAWASGDGTDFNVANVVLTPPNTTTSVTLPWSASVLLQDAATHPGTYITPIALGTNG